MHRVRMVLTQISSIEPRGAIMLVPLKLASVKRVRQGRARQTDEGAALRVPAGCTQRLRRSLEAAAPAANLQQNFSSRLQWSFGRWKPSGDEPPPRTQPWRIWWPGYRRT